MLISMHRYSSVTANELVYTNGTNGNVVFDPANNPNHAHQLRHADAELGWTARGLLNLGYTNYSHEFLSNLVDWTSGSTNGCPKFE